LGASGTNRPDAAEIALGADLPAPLFGACARTGFLPARDGLEADDALFTGMAIDPEGL